MNDKLNRALDEIDEAYIAEAAAPRKKRKFLTWAGPIAAVLAVAILAGSLWHPAANPNNPAREGSVPQFPVNGQQDQDPAIGAIAPRYQPAYPKMAPYGEDGDAWKAWSDSRRQQYDQPQDYEKQLHGFLEASIPTFLADAGDENRVYSPLNVYLALAMLAEITDGESRQQILDVLGYEDIDRLRTNAGHVWNAHYCDDGILTSLLASSLWLDDSLSYSNDTAQTLADSYYASVYTGDLGSQEMNNALRAWLNSNTGGLLEEQANQVSMSPEVLLALATTIYFNASWSSEFWEELNTQDPFYGPDGESIETYMHKTYLYGYYAQGQGYSVTRLSLDYGGYVWLILPDEGVSPAEVWQGGEALHAILNDQLETQVCDVNLSLPKFDVVSSMDLTGKLRELGITDVFDSAVADFTPIAPDSKNLAVGSMDHAARVKIDENGIEAAAFTILTVGSAVPVEIPLVEFTLDRPFLFVVTSQDNLPLFVGTVNQP